MTLNRAVAVSKVRGPAAALAHDRAARRARSRLFPFLRREGRAAACSSAAPTEARVAFDRAIALANTPAEAAHIRQHLDRLMRDSAPRAAKA